MFYVNFHGACLFTLICYSCAGKAGRKRRSNDDDEDELEDLLAAIGGELRVRIVFSLLNLS